MWPDDRDSAKPFGGLKQTSYGAIESGLDRPTDPFTCLSCEGPELASEQATSTHPKPGTTEFSSAQLSDFLSTCQIHNRPGETQTEFWLEAPTGSGVSFANNAVQKALLAKSDEASRCTITSEDQLTKEDEENLKAHTDFCRSNQQPVFDPATFSLTGLHDTARKVAAVRGARHLRYQIHRLQRDIEWSRGEIGVREMVMGEGTSWLFPNRYHLAGEYYTKETLEDDIAGHRKTTSDKSKVLAHRLLMWDRLMSRPAQEPSAQDPEDSAREEAARLQDWLESSANGDGTTRSSSDLIDF